MSVYQFLEHAVGLLKPTAAYEMDDCSQICPSLTTVWTIETHHHTNSSPTQPDEAKEVVTMAQTPVGSFNSGPYLLAAVCKQQVLSAA